MKNKAFRLALGIAAIGFAALSLAACPNPAGGEGGSGGGGSGGNDGGGTTIPVLTAGTVSRTSDTNAAIGFTTSQAGTAYYLVVNSGAAAPASAAVKTAHNSFGAVAAGTVSNKAVTLTAGAKDIYVVVEDAAGNISEPLKIAVAAYGVNPPVLSNGIVTRTGETTATVSFTTDKGGTLHYLMLNSGTTAPAPAQIIEWGGTYPGLIPAGLLSTPVSISSAAFDVYLLVVDAGGNISEPLKIVVAAYGG